MGAPNHINLGGLKVLVTRHMERAEGRGLFVARKSALPTELKKMPPGLYRLKKQHELRGVQRPEVLNINFVFENTIPRLAEAGVFSEMTESEADSVIGSVVSFASLSVKRAQDIREIGGDHKAYYQEIERFFTQDLMRYGGWIKRKSSIQEVIDFYAGVRSGQEDTMVQAIKMVADMGMVEAKEDLVQRYFRFGTAKVKLAVIEAMEKLEDTKMITDEISIQYPDWKLKIECRIKPAEHQPPGQLDPRGRKAMICGSDGNIYAYGAFTTDPLELKKSLWRIDPSRGDIMEKAAEVPAELSGSRLTHDDVRMAELDGIIYFLGGDIDNYSGPKFRESGKMSNLWSYDMKKKEWTELCQDPKNFMPDHLLGIYGHAMVSGPDKSLYVFGGSERGSIRNNNEFMAFNEKNALPGAVGWKNLGGTVPEELTERLGHGMVVGQDGNFYVFGGYGKKLETAENVYFKELWMFDHSSYGWVNLSHLVPVDMTPRAYHSMVTGRDGNVYILGGERKVNYVSDVEWLKDMWVFNPKTQEFKQIKIDWPDDIFPACHCMAVSPDGTIYLLAGSTKEGADSLWRLSISRENKDLIERAKAKLSGKEMQQEGPNGSA